VTEKKLNLNQTDAYSSKHPNAELASLLSGLLINEQNILLHFVSMLSGRYVSSEVSPEASREVVRILPFLSYNQSRAALLVAQRLLYGQRHYGAASFESDTRNMVREGADELADFAVYSAWDFFAPSNESNDDERGVLRALRMAVRRPL